jgi:uncharacterized protein YggT (Ycf19 family)
MLLEDDKLAIDETQRIAEHEAVKQDARRGVHAEIAREADRLDEREKRTAAAVGEGFKRKAIAEVVDTEAEVERARTVARISQVIDYIFYVIYGLISLEIILDLLGARETNTFNRFVESLNRPLLGPFRGLLADPANGRFQLRLSYVIALVVYILLHLAINGLLRLVAHRKVAV